MIVRTSRFEYLLERPLSDEDRRIYDTLMGEDQREDKFSKEILDKGEFLFADLLKNHYGHLSRNLRVILAADRLFSDVKEDLDFNDPSHKIVSRLEGEIDRYVARCQQKPSWKVELTRDLVLDYCKTQDLRELEPIILEKLGYKN